MGSKVHSKDIKSDLLSELESSKLNGFMDMVVSENLKSESSPDASKTNSKKPDPLSAFKSAKLNDNEGSSSPSKTDDDENGFMDMVVSTSLIDLSRDYSRDSEDKQSKFSGSKEQGRFGLSSYKSICSPIEFQQRI